MPSSASPSEPLPVAPPPFPAGVYVLVALLIACHTALNGIRITVLLTALDRGGNALTVGVLTAMFNLLPAFLAIRAGRMVDRVPLKKPLLWGALLMATGAAVATVHPTFGVLLLCACLTGLGWLLVAASGQYAIGLYGGTQNRVRAFSLMSMAFSVAAFIGPLSAGFLMDYYGHQTAFASLSALMLITGGILLSQQVRMPTRKAQTSTPEQGSARDLLAIPSLRNILITATFITVGWELYLFLVPVLGASLKLTATQIGSVMSCYALAVFLVRFGVGWLSKRLGERGLMISSMVLAGLTFLAFPFAGNYVSLLLLSFSAGMGLGASQPIILSLLYTASPPGRVGEVNGMRMTMISTSQWTMPLLFGSLSASFGLLPLFIAIGGGILFGSWWASKRLQIEQD